MIDMIAALQPLVVGAVLIWSARVKLLDRHAATVARRSALVRLVGEHRALPAYRLLGAVELILGALLLLPPALRLETAAATAVAVGFLGYLTYARRAAPTSSCGWPSRRPTPGAGRRRG
ncbi:MauE/DoxX family redox-associated membrane protein, partial [Micromonospora sp. MA102]|uniref:MauE/DoxX family redox-associated membrane protein n=1 Tax=Micromonospora sp. MA102 TaxID=2952755 RepID=UPI0021C8BE96